MTVALVTGLAGQDGSYLTESLLAQGFEVHGVVRSASDAAPIAAAHPSVIIHALDLADTEGIDRLVTDTSPDEIYNLAAISSVYQSWQEPVLTARVNALAVVQLVDSAWNLQVSTGRPVRFVQASSAELFGQATVAPQDERTSIAPVSPYGAAKAYAHHIVSVYRGRGLAAANCVLYNHESPRRPESFVTRKITAGAARISRGLQETLQLGTLAVRRDWGWAPDYTRALEMALRAERPDDFVIATGETHELSEFLAIAFARVGIEDWRRHVEIDPAFSRPVDPTEQVGDASKAREILGWSTTRTFAEVVEAMVDADLAVLDGAGISG